MAILWKGREGAESDVMKCELMVFGDTARIWARWAESKTGKLWEGKPKESDSVDADTLWKELLCQSAEDEVSRKILI